MNLAGLFPWLEGTSAFQEVVRRLASDNAVEVEALSAARPFFLATLFRSLGGPLLVVVGRSERAKALHEELQAWGLEEALLFPEPDPLPYERLAWDAATVQGRLKALYSLVRWQPGQPAPLIVASVPAVARRSPSPDVFSRACQTLKPGMSLKLSEALSHWLSLGYKMVSTVEGPGMVARRGGILDIYPATAETPARLELVGDQVESLRRFNPEDQRSLGLLDSLDVTPAWEMVPGEEVAEPSALSDERLAEEVAQLLSGQEAEAPEFYAPIFNGGCLLDYLPPQACLALEEAGSLEIALTELDEEASGLRRGMMERGELSATFPRPYFLWPELEARVRGHRRLAFSSSGGPETVRLPFGSPPVFGGRLEPWFRQMKTWLGEGQATVVVSQQAARLSEMMEAEDILCPPKPALEDPPSPGSLHLTPGALAEGWSLDSEGLPAPHTEAPVSKPPRSPFGKGGDAIPPPSAKGERGGWRPPGYSEPPLETDSEVRGRLPSTSVAGPARRPQLLLVTDTELFGFVKRRRRARRRFLRREEALGDLTPGEYVIHIDHGVARFAGLVRMGKDGAERLTMSGAERPVVSSVERPAASRAEREYLVLEYASGDKLYVPTDLAGRVSRYVGPSGHVPALTRLGSQDWERAKKRATEAAAILAKELVELYAAREAAQGLAFSPDTPWQQEMEAAFPYEETPDQLRAVIEVKADMERSRPMDRLVCGDVGYGKTEVAVRAAFKAVQDGMQVAVLVPTTILAQQHLQTFQERLKAFPVRVAMLSRFLSDKEQREVAAKLALGAVDVCIGTHRMLQKDIAFKNLGLVVVDEEQRFGVAHKERFKQMRREVDVLSLSATPIPRTLYMSLTGLRDMSAMETPPDERLPIKTYTGPYDPRLVREAILREMERGGQVFLVHNRVHDIFRVAQDLSDLVPEADVAVGHGQMPEEALEKVMFDFATGKHDVLVCTTIIESGLDMPNVNTLIVDRSEWLGLSQLYQLRGRVGRGSERAYAYFFYRKDTSLSETAEKRLRTIFEATELGAGFRIAMKDLEIRGAGNLLGAEQSGHIGAVGFDLYCRILAEAVETLKGKPKGPAALPPPSVNLPLAALIPESYVSDPGARLNLYQRLALLTEVERLDDLETELHDRFGPPPEEVEDLLYTVRLKVVGAKAGASEIVMEEGQVVVHACPDAGLGLKY